MPARRSNFAPWSDPSKTPIVRFENVTKRFGDTVAIDTCTLDIYEREFFALLGPSGCGKTTLLRMLAGFETPSEGRIIVDGRDITQDPPYKRPINMMFQSYALFPHMTVERNIGFGLRQEGMPAAKIAERVEEAMTMLELTKLACRKPRQLSGGQQQRVALARAIAKKPRILLLDEPLAALDKRLREQAQFELMGLQEKTGTTFIIVTHDQEEAMTVSSRIAVMDHGRVVQVATPGEIYETPASSYVAKFIGDVNLFEGSVAAVAGGSVEIEVAQHVRFKAVTSEDLAIGERVSLALRPEKIRISAERPPESRNAMGMNAIGGRVIDIGYLGSVSHYYVRLASGETVKALRANAANAEEHPIGRDDEVWLQWPADAGVVLTR